MLPIPASIRPSGVKEKKPSSMLPERAATSATNRLVDEPISVVMPPRIAMKESGISNRAEGRPCAAATAERIGRNITTTGVLFRKPLMIATPTRIGIVARWGKRLVAVTTILAGVSRALV